MPSRETLSETHEKISKILLPLDKSLGLGFQLLKKTKVYDGLKNTLYEGGKTLSSFNIKTFNRLKVFGLEKLPPKGGYLLAANHQSWLDPQVLTVGIPRKIHFLIKSELTQWPLVRHFVEISHTIIIRRQGDEKALSEAADLLKKGEVVCIFPEGTIPGEEEIPRWAINKQTGLLDGKTGVIRLAQKASVPIVPVGISGTGRAFPPEAYPRMDIHPLPKPHPVKLRIGKPISLRQYSGKNLSREELRNETKKVMRTISALVDHTQNYIPLDIPMEEIPQYNKIGVLLLHGFTSGKDAVSGLLPHLEKLKIPYKMPVLRGHQSRFQDLQGVTYKDWVADAEKALLELSKTVDKLIVVGLSMGGLVTLKLAMDHADKIAGIVTIAAALKFADPLAGFSKVLSKVVPYWPGPKTFNDKNLAKNNTNYKWFPTKTFVSLYDFAKVIEENLYKVKVPILVVHSKEDHVISASAANTIYEKVASPHREIKWFYKSGHEMMQDMEAEDVFKAIDEFVLKFRKTPSAIPS